jgi:hypothetical protein
VWYRVVRVLVVATMLGLVSLDLSAGASAAGWGVVPSPNRGFSWIYGVRARTPADAWAVGNYFEEDTYEPLAEHWDGASWSIVETPDIETDSILRDVAPVSSSEAWAVGESNTRNHPTRTLVLHWDGSAWAAVPSPSPSRDPFYGENALYGVAALPSGEAWAVGYRYTGGYQALILRWDGVRWSPMQVPAAGYRKLTGIVARSASDLWAVGYDFTFGRGYQPISLHWDGIAWRTVRFPRVAGANAYLNDVTSTPSGDLWAAGQQLVQGVTQPLVAHWDGQAWSLVPSPPLEPDYNFLEGIQALSDDDVWAAGYSTLADRDVSFAEHWDGARWSLVSLPQAPGGGNLVWDLAADDGGNLWAGGYIYPLDFSETSTLLLRLEP